MGIKVVTFKGIDRNLRLHQSSVSIRFTIRAKFARRHLIQFISDKRRIHRISPISVNGKKIVQVVIDAHYEAKHSKSINDSLILELVAKLDGRRELPEGQRGPDSYMKVT